ncbi:MAG: 23S rRNA (uracil(1939)-C(5))-methyltransferase RlmD [Simkaniaceae bacterium]|nr:23S rRNA (uracil(1939)-C(5))-methyltransferase RlmD [Simkaniaceae bacterium]
MEELLIQIDRLGINGEGVGTHEGYRVFIDGALPGETVKATLHLKKKSYAKGVATEILQSAPERVSPICPVFGTCGGCQLMHLKYEAQLQMKRQLVVDALERIGKLKGVTVNPCLSSPKELHYRNKIQLPVTQNKAMGLYEKGSHRIVEIEKCFIHTEIGEAAFCKVKEALQKQSIPDKLRHVLIKSAVHTGEVLIIFVTEEAPSVGLTKLAHSLIGGSIRGVIHNKNQESGNRILGPHFITLAGYPTITEVISGLKFKVSPASFFQVNPFQAPFLYQIALDGASLQGTEVVWDAFCGVGTLALLFAKKAKQVIGTEVVHEAILDAWENSERNGIQNVYFETALAENYCKKLPLIDIALLNPPRKGCEPALIEHLIAKEVKRVIYVSCDPATLARDLALLTAGGYQVSSVQPVDMFPQTSHVETVVFCIKGS